MSTSPETQLKVPPLKKGWMSKQSRTGVVRNWKKRFFVLDQGKISYYVDESPNFPYGENFKGDMNLVNTEIVIDKTKPQDKMIYVVSFNGENNILMEAQSKEEAVEWIQAIRAHIAYSNVRSENRASTARVPRVSVTAASNPNISPRPSSSGDSADVADSSKTKESTPAASEVTPSRSATEEKSSTSTPVTIEKPIEATELLEKSIDFASRIAGDNDYRKKFVGSYKTGLTTAISAGTVNWSDGALGERGEKLLGAAAILLIAIVLGHIPYFYRVVNFVLNVAAVLMMLGGVTLAVTALTDLGSNMSFVLTPSPNNTIVSTGAYSLVRHPIYGGIVLFSFGRAIVADHAFQVLLAIALSMVLNYAAEAEEDFLEKKHPKEYPVYAANRKVLVPFLY